MIFLTPLGFMWRVTERQTRGSVLSGKSHFDLQVTLSKWGTLAGVTCRSHFFSPIELSGLSFLNLLLSLSLPGRKRHGGRILIGNGI